MLQFDLSQFNIPTHGDSDIYITAIGLLEEYIQTFEAAESHDEVVDNFARRPTGRSAICRSCISTSWYV